jgi:iron complex outermembrane receptor protein
MRPIHHLLATSAAAALVAAAATPVLAAAEGGAQVDEVIVTAQKRAENVQDVPISLEVVSGKTLEAFHADTFADLKVPNLNFGAVGGNFAIYIRGFGSPSQNYAFDQAVSLYDDGVYAGKSRQFMAPFFDLERVEVLRGPQGALFGKNTAAGAISVISGQPTKTFEGAATAIYNFDLQGYELSGHVSGPLTDKLSGRLAVRFVDQDGYIKNLAPGAKKETTNTSQLVRGILRYDDTAFDYSAKVEYGHFQSDGNATVAGPVTTEQRPRLTRFAAEDTGRLGPAGFETTTWNISGTGNLRLGEFTLTSISGYSYFNASHVNNFDQTIPGGGVTPPTVFNSEPEHFQQLSQEVRLQSPTGGKFDYIVGAYYDNAQYRMGQYSDYNIIGLGVFLLTSHFKQQAESYSLFGQGVYHFTDALRLQGSLRYSSTSKRGQFTSASLQGPFPLRPITSAKGKIDEDRVDPSVTLQYDVNRDLMVYAAYGEGSKSGGFVSNTYGTTDATFTFRPEHSQNIEAGLKSTLLDGRLVLDAAIYRIKFDNLQVSTYNPNVQAYLVGNAAKASGKGIELNATLRPAQNFDISGSVAYQDVQYDDYPGAQCLASQPVSQCNPNSPASVLANNLKGTPLPNISKFSGNVQVHYVYDLANDWHVGTTLSVAGRSKFFNSDDESPLYGLQPGYAKLDARVELYPTNTRWRLAVVGKNLTNELTTTGSFRLPTPITTVTRALYWVEPPRNVSIEASMRF